MGETLRLYFFQASASSFELFVDKVKCKGEVAQSSSNDTFFAVLR